jgi:D-alanyl-D-alanine carboxypeptidase/D-alanyl-D-alanine-endopeptidase (penicillin-binding protein 4)
MVVSLEQGDTLFAQNADRLLVPASNLKLFTSAAALYYLGPDFRYNTFLLATGPVEGGVLQGDLVVYGTGDPTISSRYGSQLEVWQAFADTLGALGIREVRGDVIGDGSYFAGAATGAGWKEDYMNASYAAPAGALSYAENIATLEIRPAAQAGWRPEVRLVPGGNGIALVNEATTVARGRSFIHVTRAGYDGPITVRGQISRASGALQRSIPVSDPARYAAAVLHEVLEKSGIEVTGMPVSVQTPEQSPVTGRSVFAPAFDGARPLRVLALHNSPPLLSILEVVNKRSHNLMAEQALRTVARVATGEGSVEGGARAVLHLLDEATPGDPAPIELYDGSGLSPLNRVTPRSIVQLLTYMAAGPMWESYWQTLPEAGSGNLRRMHQTRAQGNLRAKTGTIDNVSALAGYVRAANGERLAFSIISNNVASTWRAKRVEDAIGARLADFTRAGDFTLQQDPDSLSAPPRTEPKPPEAQRAEVRTHRIRRGDTLDAIARRYGVTVAELRRANGNIRPNRLMPGKTLRIP